MSNLNNEVEIMPFRQGRLEMPFIIDPDNEFYLLNFSRNIE
jgi:hypothetical protein